MVPSWIDILALLAMAACMVIGARRGLVFGLGAAMALVLYLMLAPMVPAAARPLAVLVLAFGGALLSKSVVEEGLSNVMLDRLAGAVGGLMWGALFAVLVWVAFPGYKIVSTNAVEYPSRLLPSPVSKAISTSQFAKPVFKMLLKDRYFSKILLPEPRIK